MGPIQENSHCGGQVDRYRLLGQLPALALTNTVSLRRFAAIDEVSAQAVILETLPPNFGRNKQLLLRKFLSRKGIREQSDRSQAGLPSFMHEVWELDEEATACSGLSAGETLLVYNVSNQAAFNTRRLDKYSLENCQFLAAVCELLKPAHQKNQGHGFLLPETIWGTTPGDAQLTDSAVASFLSHIEAGGCEETIIESTPEQDLQALKKLCRQWQDGQQIFSALQNASDMPTFLEALKMPLLAVGDAQSPPAAVIADSAALLASMSAEPSSQSPVALSADNSDLRPQSSPQHFQFWRKISLALVALLVILVAIFLTFWLQRQPASATAEPVAQEQLSAIPPLVLKKTLTRLDQTFALSFRLDTVLETCGPLQLTFLGQNIRVDLLWTEHGLDISRHTGQSSNQFVPWGTPPQPGEQFSVSKTLTSIAAYRNGTFLAGESIGQQQWRQVKWLNASENTAIPALSQQKIGTLLFTDDFMHSDGALGEWKIVSGVWAVHSLQTPVRSANPFSFIGKGDKAEAAVGYWFWRNYRLQCAIQPLDAPSLGVKFSRFNEQTYYALHWDKGLNANSSNASISLLRVADGEEKTLASVPLPQIVQSWYDLSVSQQEGLLEVRVGGNVIINVIDRQPLLGGGISLLSSGNTGAIFDDVKVAPCDSLRLPCPNGLPEDLPLLWQYEKIPQTTAEQDSQLVCHSLWLTQPELSNAILQVDFAALPSNQEKIELSLRNNGIQEVIFSLFKLEAKPGYRADIILRRLGRDTILVSNDCEIPTISNGNYHLALHLRGTDAWGSCNDQTLCFYAGLPNLAAGQAGIRQFAAADSTPGWRDISYSLQLPLAPPLERVSMFSHEESMRLWNDPVLEWQQVGELLWYRGDFWQDVNASLDLRQALQLSAKADWGVLFGTQEKTSSANSAVARLLYQPAKKTLQLQLEDKIVETLECPQPPLDITMQRCGSRLLVKQDGNLLWNYPLPERLDGLCLVGRIGYGDTAEWANALTIVANGITSYSFQEAPSAWLTASGVWEITNRWQCDPRWSFFSGLNLEGPACLWNKFQHGDRVSFDFYVGPKMDTDRGKKYEYAGDFSLVLGADGRDISSGYSFMFAGWDNRGSQIVRQKEIVKENTAVTIPRSSNIHRQWFHLKVRKNHDVLTFWADGNLVGTYLDPEPLPGRRFGLWTWRNGFMISQFRVSSDDYSPAPESITEAPITPQTPYN